MYLMNRGPSRLYKTNSEISKEDIEEKFGLRDFLEENYTLFAILGIFGALSVYLNQLVDTIGQDNRTLKIGIAGSLAIVLLIVAILIVDTVERIGGGNEVLGMLISDKNEYRPILLFAVPFAGVVYTLISVIGNFVVSLSILIQLGAGMFGIILATKVTYHVEDAFDFESDKIDLFEDGVIKAGGEILKMVVVLGGGYVFTDNLRSSMIENLGSTEIIYVTSKDASSAVVHAISLGAQGYFGLLLSLVGFVVLTENLASARDLLHDSMNTVWNRVKANL